MQRGLLQTTKSEINAYIAKVGLEKYANTPLFEKLTASTNSAEEDIQIELSQDELEDILDDIIIPDPKDESCITSLRTKIENLIYTFSQQ